MTEDQLIEWILSQARKGVYRSYLMSYSSYSKQDTAAAIRAAKSRGMYTVPDMRSLDGDTWYQYGAIEPSIEP